MPRMRQVLSLFFLLFLILSQPAQAGEVITELRFREGGLIARPEGDYFIVIDLKGGEHKIEVGRGDRFVLSDSSQYRGPKQYSTENGERIYKRVRMGGEIYHWFYASDPSTRAWIEKEINQMVQSVN